MRLSETYHPFPCWAPPPDVEALPDLNCLFTRPLSKTGRSKLRWTSLNSFTWLPILPSVASPCWLVENQTFPSRTIWKALFSSTGAVETPFLLMTTWREEALDSLFQFFLLGKGNSNPLSRIFYIPFVFGVKDIFVNLLLSCVFLHLGTLDIYNIYSTYQKIYILLPLLEILIHKTQHAHI